MLKIKDNVDLKELEKFGFVPINDVCYEYIINESVDESGNENEISILVYRRDFGKAKAKELYFYVYVTLKYDEIWQEDACTDELYKLDVIFDLIQAGLVEKVSD